MSNVAIPTSASVGQDTGAFLSGNFTENMNTILIHNLKSRQIMFEPCDTQCIPYLCAATNPVEILNDDDARTADFRETAKLEYEQLVSQIDLGHNDATDTIIGVSKRSLNS